MLDEGQYFCPPPPSVSGWLIRFVSRSQVTFQELHPIVFQLEFENTLFSAHYLAFSVSGLPRHSRRPQVSLTCGRLPSGRDRSLLAIPRSRGPDQTLPCPSISQPLLISRKRMQDKGASEVCPLILFVSTPILCSGWSEKSTALVALSDKWFPINVSSAQF